MISYRDCCLLMTQRRRRRRWRRRSYDTITRCTRKIVRWILTSQSKLKDITLTQFEHLALQINTAAWDKMMICEIEIYPVSTLSRQNLQQFSCLFDMSLVSCLLSIYLFIDRPIEICPLWFPLQTKAIRSKFYVRKYGEKTNKLVTPNTVTVDGRTWSDRIYECHFYWHDIDFALLCI